MATAPASASDLVELLQKSGLIEGKSLDQMLGLFPDGLPAEPRDVAEALIRTGHLTGFQANQLLVGKYRGFFLGKYKLLEILGTGGMGSVFLAEQTAMRRLVAVKVLPPTAVKEKQVLERFYREARAAAALSHPNIVRAYDIDREGNVHFLVMEYVDGINLHHLLERRNPLGVEQVCHYIRQAALGLQCIHENNLVHRDIKPGNLVLDRAGTVRILDLGLARFFEPDDNPLTKELDSSKVLGTADFLAPEQGMNSHDVDIRADIYSLGATMYYLLAGKAPFAGSSVMQKLVHHQMKDPPPIETVRADVPAELGAVMRRMMAKERDNRQKTPKEVAAALEPWTRNPPAVPGEEEIPKKIPLLLGLGGGSTITPSSGPQTRNVRGTRSNGGTPFDKRDSAVTNSTLAADLSRPEGSTIVAKSGDEPTKPLLSSLPAVVPAPSAPPAHRMLKRVLAGSLAILVAAASAAVYFSKQPTSDAVARSNPKDVDASKGVLPKPEPVIVKPDPTTAKKDPVAPKKNPAPAKADDPKLPPLETKALQRVDVDSKIADRLAVSQNSQFVAMPGADHRIELFNGNTLEPRQTLTGPTARTTALAFSSNSKLLVGGSEDGAVTLWNSETGEKVRDYAGHTGAVAAVATASKYLAAGGRDGTLRVWDLETAQTVCTFDGHKAAVASIMLLPNVYGFKDVLVLSGAADGVVHLVNAKTGASERSFEVGRPVLQVSVPFASRTAVAVVTASSAFVYRPFEDKVTAELSAPGEKLTRGFMSGDGRNVLASTESGKLLIWDVAAKALVHEAQLHDGPITGIGSPGDGTHLYSSGGDDKLIRWDLPIVTANAQGYPTYASHKGAVYAARASSDEKWLATAGEDGRIQISERSNNRTQLVLEGHTGPVRGLAWLPGDKQLLSASEDKSIRLWDAETGKALGAFAQTEAPLHSATLSAGGELLLTGGLEKCARLWDVADRKPVREFGLAVPADKPTLAAFLGKGELVLTAAAGESRALVWTTATGKLVKELALDSPILGFDPLPSGKGFAWFDAKSAFTTSIETGVTAKLLDMPNKSEAKSIAVSPDGDWLLSGCNAHVVALVHLPTGKTVFRINDPVGQVTTALQFSRNNSHAYVGDAAGAFRQIRLNGVQQAFLRYGEK